MSQEQLKGFLENVKQNKTLLDKLTALTQDDPDAMIKEGLAFATELGYDITVDDWNEFNASNEDRPLSDDEMDMVAGGGSKGDYAIEP